MNNKEYKNIRFKKYGKYLIELITSNLVKDLKEKTNEINEKIEDISNDYIGYSITAIIKVSTSSVIELAFNNFDEFSLEHYNHLYSEYMKNQIEIENKNLNIGSLTPKLFLNKETLSLIDKLSFKYKGNRILKLKDREVIEIVLFDYCKRNGLI